MDPAVLRTIRSNRHAFIQILSEPHEYGGVIEASKNLVSVRHKATNSHPNHLNGFPEYPKSTGLVSWHTHPQFIRETQKKEGWMYPEEAIPSNEDIIASLQAALYYKEPTINVVISNELIGVFYPSKALLKFMLKQSKYEQESIIKEYVEPNLRVAFGRVSESTTTIPTFKKEVASLIDDGVGYVFEEYHW